MSVLTLSDLNSLFTKRDERSKELLEILLKESNDKNPLRISGLRAQAIKDANDEMLIQLLEKLNLLESK